LTIQLSELLFPRPEPLWTLVKQVGVNTVVALLNGAEQSQKTFTNSAFGRDPKGSDERPWSKEALRRNISLFADYGLEVIAIEDTPPMDKVRLGLPGRDEQIANIIEQITAMGELGIRLLSYNWMVISNWTRTSMDVQGRGGALVNGFSSVDADKLPPLVEDGEVTSEQLWDALTYFLEAVVPVAERYGLRLGMHPDDPPLPKVRNVPRIMTSAAAFQRLLALYPSSSNAITLCQGNFTLMQSDLPALIQDFGSGDHIVFSHFRDVHGPATEFVETFHDEGDTDMAECMRAYYDVGFAGPMRPDHVPTLYGESNDSPSYGTLGRLFAIGYIRGLQQAIYGK
jgi:mannonate dehydratase